MAHLDVAAATLLLAISAIIAWIRPAWPLWLQALWRIAALIALTWLLRHMLGSPLDPHFDAPTLWPRLLEAGWWVMAARGLASLIRLVIKLEHRPRETRILSDLLAGVIYAATILAIINFAFQVPIRGVLATSGVIAIVLGLALQSTLSDVFSGIAVGLERPFRVGDLIWVEGAIEGRVVQMNWRATQIATAQNSIAIVPNSIIAKSRLINRSLPTPMRSDSLQVRLDAQARPEACIAALTAATRLCQELLPTPQPSIACTELHGDGSVYEITFATTASDHLTAARTELLRHVHRQLRHDGIALAVPNQATLGPTRRPGPAELLAQSDLFGCIRAVERDLLATHLTEVSLATDEVLIRQGAPADALFIVASGAVHITIADPPKDGVQPPARLVYRLGPGESLGAIGLITGADYAATATAATPLRAYRLDKPAITAAITEMPSLRVALEELAKRGQAVLRRDVVAHTEHKDTQPEMFLSRLRILLQRLAPDANADG